MGGNNQYLSVVLGILLGFILFVFATGQLADVNLDKAGMGRNTVPRTGVFEDKTISAVGGPQVLFEAWDHFREEGKPLALWLGASQIYCINHIQPEDRLAVEYVNQWATNHDQPLRMLQITAPNGNLHELLAFYLMAKQKGYVPDWLVIGLVYDDLREEQVRENFLEGLAPLSEESLRLGGPGVAQLEAIRQRYTEPTKADSDPVERNPTDGTPQERLETALVGYLDQYLPGYAERDQLTGHLKVTVRAGLARMLGQVSQRRVPKISQARKHWNHAALEALVALAKNDGCRLLIYQPPHRPSEGPFYHDRASYDAYFEKVEAWLDPMPGVHFLDLETLVPADYWGMTNWGRPDVFHFQVEGHRRLAKALQAFFESQGQEQDHAIQ